MELLPEVLSRARLNTVLAYAAIGKGIVRRIRVPPYLYKRFMAAQLIPYDGIPVEVDTGLEISLVIDYYRPGVAVLSGVADAAIVA